MTNLKEEIAKTIWEELNDEAFFLSTEKLNNTAGEVLALIKQHMRDMVGEFEEENKITTSNSRVWFIRGENNLRAELLKKIDTL